MAPKDSIKISVKVALPLEKAWEIYTQEKHIMGWNFASEEWHCPTVQNNLQKGGTYLARMEAKDGSVGFDFKGIYRDVAPPKYLAYTLEDGREVRTEFEQEDDSTQVVTYFQPENLHDQDFQKQGWQAILDNFKKYAESV